MSWRFRSLNRCTRYGVLLPAYFGSILGPIAVLGDIDDEWGAIRVRVLPRVELRVLELQGGDVTSSASDLVEVRSTGGPRIDQPGIARRPNGRHLQLRQVAHDGRQHATVDLERDSVLVHVVPRPFPVWTRAERSVADRELDAGRRADPDGCGVTPRRCHGASPDDPSSRRDEPSGPGRRLRPQRSRACRRARPRCGRTRRLWWSTSARPGVLPLSLARRAASAWACSSALISRARQAIGPRPST